MRIHKLYQCFAAAVLLFLPVACDNTDYSEKSPFDNSAYLNIAASKNTETFTFNRKVTSQTKTFAVKLSYPAGDDVKVSLEVDASLTSEYMQRTTRIMRYCLLNTINCQKIGL